MVEERWVPVIGFEGYYEVSDLGNIRSLPRDTRISITRGKKTKHLESEYWHHKGKQLSPIRIGNSMYVHLYDAERRRTSVLLSHVVFASFHGLHISQIKRYALTYVNRDSSDCSLQNLKVELDPTSIVIDSIVIEYKPT